MAKKMSVAEILAAARAQKAGGAAPPAAAEAAPPTETAAPDVSTPEPVAAETPTATSEAAQAKPVPGKPAGKMSVAEILAAARAAKAGGAATPAPAAAAAPAAPKPAAPKPAAVKAPAAAKPAAAETATGGVKDTASILAAARKGAKPGPISKAELAAKDKPVEPAGKKKLEVPPMPAKPAYARTPATPAAGTSRRNFIAAASGVLFGSSLAIGFTSLAVTHLMWLLGLARYMFPNILMEPPTSFKVGFADNLGPGQVETKFIPQFGVWIVKNEYEGQPMVYALKAVCTHLGCTPNWLEAEQKFKCPCHGSGFYKDGINFEGPAPRPLERYAISVADDGQLLVDKSRTFNQELGGWKDPASFVPV